MSFTYRIRERMFQGAKVPGSESTRERKFQGAKVPFMVLSLYGAKVRGNESSSYHLLTILVKSILNSSSNFSCHCQLQLYRARQKSNP